MKQCKGRKKTEKTSGLHRLVCGLLCLVMLSGIVQSFFLSAHAQSTLSVKIEAQGARKNRLTLVQEERAALRAETNAGAQNLDYQWQILADIRAEQWVNIYDGTEQTLTVSKAMLAAVLDESCAAYVRCVVRSQESEGISDPFCISIAQAAQGAAVYEMPAVAQSAVRADNAPTGDEQDMVQITVNYLDAVSGLAIYTHFSALIHRGSSYENTVISPTYLGYKPYYNAADPSAPFPSDDSEVDAPDEALVVPISVAEDYDKASYTVNVYYKAIDVPYGVKYFFQNIQNDQYTEESSLYRQGYAKTGTIVSDAELDLVDAELKKGFTKLYHYPQAVAADGSTVFECYYDRNYSMLKFDMDGGYGTEPIYARYGTPFLVNEPVKHGYVFAGWDLLVDGKGDGIADELPATVPGKSCTYAAIWESAQTKYTVAYWLQNADDDEYRYIGSVKRDAKSGILVSPQDDLTATTPLCGDETHTKVSDHTTECYPENFKHYVYDGEKTNEVNPKITVKGDGSSVLNIYYTRKYYTLRFFYAKEYNGAQDRNPNRDPENTFTGIRYSVVGNSTYGFGNVPKNGTWFKNHQDYSLEDLFAQLTAYTSGDKWGIIEGGLPKITDPKIAGAHYVSGVYPAEGEGYQDSANPTNGNYDMYGDRFHYFELTARYGADLTDLWPVDVFGKLRVHKPETHTANGGADALTDINGTEGEGWGNYAYPSGWNGEYKVRYSIENANATVKGLYQKLNDTLLLGKWGSNEYEYEDSDNMIRKIKTVTTIGGKAVDSNVCYFLNFFDNGANVNWSIPRQWIYQSYVPVFQNELTASEESQIKAAGAPIALGGKTYYYHNNTVYRLYNTVTTNDDNIIKSGGGDSGQTQSDLEGFEKIKDSTRYELVDNGTLTDRRRSFTA